MDSNNVSSLNARELMRLHVEALFAHDARGRVVRVNAPAGGRAPRFFIGRTPDGNLWRARDDVDENTLKSLRALAESEALGPVSEESSADVYAAILARTARIERVWSGPAFVVEKHSTSPGCVVLNRGDENMLRPRFPDWILDLVDSQPFIAAIENGEAVAVCCSVRRTAAAHEAGVETHPEFRGRGYASRAVAAWAHALHEQGVVPLYSTSWTNVASRGVARRLGLQAFGADLHFT